jgi:hypothetical protein
LKELLVDEVLEKLGVELAPWFIGFTSLLVAEKLWKLAQNRHSKFLGALCLLGCS